MPQYATLLHRSKTESSINSERFSEVDPSCSFHNKSSLQEAVSRADTLCLSYVHPRTSTTHYEAQRTYPANGACGCESHYNCSMHLSRVEQPMYDETAPWLHGPFFDFNINSLDHGHDMAYFQQASSPECTSQLQFLAPDFFVHSSSLENSPVTDSANLDYVNSMYSPDPLEDFGPNEFHRNNDEVFLSAAFDGMSDDSTIESQASEARNIDEPYAKLIYRALMAAPNHSMVLQEIYEWFLDNTDKKKTTEGWKNSIRHNLSMNAAFRKTDRRTDRKATSDEPKKSSEWMLEAFAVGNGVTPTTRYRKTGKKTGRSRYATLARRLAGASGGKQSGKVKIMQRGRERCNHKASPVSAQRTRKSPQLARNTASAYARQTSSSTPSEKDLCFLRSSCLDQEYLSTRCPGQAVYSFTESEGAFMGGQPRYDANLVSSGNDLGMNR